MDADRAALRFVIGIDETGQDILRTAGRFSFRREWHEDHLIAAAWIPVPRSVLTDERAVFVIVREQPAGVEGEPKRRGVRTKRVIRHDRLGDQIRAWRIDANIDVLAVIAIGPAVEATI